MPKILVVDDNEQLSSMLKDVLESWGYTALIATEGRSCLATARREHPDIVLLDIMLPGLSGYEVCSELKRNAGTQSIAVIMMTALEDMESRIHGYKVGADNFLVKPINYNEVKAIIQKLLKDKMYHDMLEESCSVAKTLQTFEQLLLGKPTNINAPNMVYSKKLLESLNWDEATVKKARMALMFPSPVEVAEKTHLSVEQIISLTDNLNMGRWLKPMLRFLNAPVDNNAEFRTELEKQNCLKAAELALIVNRYTTLLKEKQNRELTFSILKRESAENHYNKEILKHLEEILRAEQILESIQ